MRFGLFGSAQAKRGGPDVDSGAGFREFVERNIVAEEEAHGRTFDPMRVAVARSINVVRTSAEYEQAIETRMAARRRTQQLAQRPHFDDTREERTTLGPHHTVIIPAETPHAWGNAGTEVARLLWAFAGPDPFSDATYLAGEPPVH